MLNLDDLTVGDAKKLMEVVEGTRCNSSSCIKGTCLPDTVHNGILMPLGYM